jgi:hypothetical protein
VFVALECPFSFGKYYGRFVSPLEEMEARNFSVAISVRLVEM